MVTGLALAGVAYALNARREGRPLLADGQLDHWREELRPRLDRLQEQYGPTIRKMAVAAGFMPGLKLRWRMLAAAMPQIVTALQNATAPAPTRRSALLRRGARI
jgi:hypothetical protein